MNLSRSSRSPYLRCAVLPAALLVSGATPQESALATDYARRGSVACTQTIVFSLETVEFEMMVDGQPREGRSGSASEWAAEVAWVDRWLADEAGAPTAVRRSFGEVAGSSERVFGENSNASDLESPFADAVILLELEEGAPVADVEEGDADEEQAAQLGLALRWDGLLPEAGTEEGATWELGNEAFLAAIGLADHAILFPPQEPEEAEEPGRRGRRGGRVRTPAELFAGLEWTVELTLQAADEEGIAVIGIEAHGEGEPASRDGGPGGDRGGAMELSGSHAADLDGELRFSLADRLPVALELEGRISLASERSSSSADRELSIRQLEEGEFSLEAEARFEPDADSDA